jgi:predicted phage tail protein
MPQALLVMGSSILYAAGGVALTSTAAIMAVGALGYLAATAATSMALNALIPKPKLQGVNRGYQTNARGSALDHQIIYGRVKTGGAIIYNEATGVNNKDLHRIIAYAGHEVTSFDEIYVNHEVVTLDGTGNVISPAKYDGLIRIKKHLGSPSQTADTALVAESDGLWTTQHTLNGIAYLYIRLSFSSDAFPNGVPEITATIKGKKIYDPRDGTTDWSDNPALCIRDYITSGYGLGEDAAQLDDTLVSAAANVCDDTDTEAGTTRYTCNGAFLTSATPYDMLNDLLTSMGGMLWYAQGKWRMKPAYWTEPVLSLTNDDLRSGLNVSTRHSRRDNFNIVKGTFRGEESNWQVTDYPEIKGSDFIVADGGQESTADIDLPFTDTSIEARRIARVALERNRQQLTVQASFGLRALAVQVGDNITLTVPRMGWDNKEFEVLSWNFGLVDTLDLQVTMTLREISESVFDEVDDGIVYERDNTTLLSPFEVPGVGLNATVVAKVFAEKLVNELTLTVTSASDLRIDSVEVQYKAVADTDYTTVGSGELGKFVIIDLEKGFYDARARAINTFGVKGEWEYLFNIEVDALSAPPANVTNFTKELSAGTIFFSWNAVPDLDLSYYRIKHNPNTSGAKWGNSSTVIKKVARPSTVASLPARSGTFLIKAFDKNGNQSVAATTLVVLPTELPPLGTSQTLTESPTLTQCDNPIR